MAIGDTLEGKRVTLRPVETEDAAFTLKLRRDEKLTEYIPRLSGTLEHQRQWIARQRKKEGDFFFIIENHSREPVGTLSYYDVKGRACELGRFISYGNAFENVEASLLLVTHLFERGFTRIILNCDERNKSVIQFWKKFGAVFATTVRKDAWTAAQYELTPDMFMKNKDSIIKLLFLKE